MQVHAGAASLYETPIQEQQFLLRHVAGTRGMVGDTRFPALSDDMIDAIIDSAAKFAEAEFGPLSQIGDVPGPRWESGRVIMPEGYRRAYDMFVETGWGAIGCAEEHGGAGFPFALATLVLEDLSLANLGFAAIAMLTAGACEALEAHGSESQKRVWLEKLVTGEWPGTMNLTEPQAGSDVGALRTSAVPADDGLYRIKGQKIFISFGEHDLASNIVHLVLARVPDAPPGSKGVSLFLVPKFRLDAQGKPTIANDVRCVSIEHKLGLHASPTCALSFGDDDDCLGEIIGAEGHGMRAMFTMMNNARINVGNQGVQVAERARQLALAYARSRIQSARADGSSGTSSVAIIGHPDVRRMLLRMNALTQGARALLYYAAGLVDSPRPRGGANQSRLDLLTPLVKAYCSDVGCEVASLGIQIHGGMGFIEETGASQHYRDARILPIYEGTNGIQAADLVGRKLLGDGGQALRTLIADVRDEAGDEPGLRGLADAVEEIGRWMLEAAVNDRLAGSYTFLTMTSVLVAGWLMARQAREATADLDKGSGDHAFLGGKIAAARFYLDYIVHDTIGQKRSAMFGAGILYSVADDEL